MDNQQKVEIFKRKTEEILKEEDFLQLLETGEKLKHYIGFEISGKIHLGTGLMTGIKIADFQKIKADCSCYLATYHAWINNKLGGDLEVIRRIGEGYFKEGLIASIDAMGGDTEKVRFVTGHELYHNNDEFWRTVIEVSKNINLARAMKSITIMGRKEGDSVNFAQLIYPPMQVADIFIQHLNIAHAGMDQRKAHVIARDVALKLNTSPLINKEGKKYKPVAVHHHLILGLQSPAVWPIPKESMQELWSEMKMSKSVPNSAVFITDEPDEIRKKLHSAFCPEKEIGFNPVLDWTKYLVFNKEKDALTVERPEKFGGTKEFASYEEVERDFASGALHPLDLKKAVAEKLIGILAPVRKHFEKPKIAKMKAELDSLMITR